MDQAQFRALKSLIEPCQTVEELNNYIINHWNIQLPWDVLDEDSTSSPLAFVWGVYRTLLYGEGATRHVLAAARNGGKCIQEGTLVATPKGPVEIQNLKEGDLVYDEFGKPVKVLALWDQGVQECVSLENSNKEWVTCTANHRFLGYDQRRPDNKKEVRPEMFYGDIKVCRVELNLPMGDKHIQEAYALGVMLGDGCRGNGSMSISSATEEIPNKLAKSIGGTAKKSPSNNYAWSILTPENHTRNTRWVWSEYYEKWCRNKYAHEKICDIEEIKTWSRESLLELFAGILDSDGSVTVAKRHNTGQINIEVSMQARSVIEAVKWMLMALWQVDVNILVDARERYKNGPVYRVRISHNHHNKRILRELTPHLAVDRKKYQPEYDDFISNNFNPDGVGFKVVPVGKKRCWDITVDSPTSLFCLQNGLVTHNTLTSSMLQFFSLIHFRRDGAHIAATLDQSSQATRYLTNFLNIPILQPYLITDNVKFKEFHRLPPNDFTSRGDTKIQVVTASKKGANAPRASFMTFDEVDLTPREILSEAAFIADPAIRYKTQAREEYILEEPETWYDKTDETEKRDTIFVYLSSRKTNDGPIQDLIDEAEKPDAKENRIKLHKWSSVDWMEKCEPEVYKPENGKFDAYLHTETLEVIWGKDDFETLVPGAAQTQYKHISAYEGCKTCPAFTACQSRSANQKSSSPMLRTRQFVGDVLKAVRNAAAIIAQALNWKPETTGLVFKSFSRHKHLKDPIDFYEWINGSRFNPMNYSEEELDRIEHEGTAAELKVITPTKADIYEAMVERGYTIGFGVDWGFYPDPAVVIVTAYHKRLKKCAILHFEQANNHANHIWARHIGTKVHPRFPAEFVAPDLADKASPSYFSTKEFKIPSLDSKPARIEPGVSFLRGLLWDPIAQVTRFAVLDDSQMEVDKHNVGNHHVVEAFEHWTHKKTLLGGWDMKKFADDQWTHPIDALRYFLDPFIEDVQINISVAQSVPETAMRDAAAMGDKEAVEKLQAKQELKTQFQEHMEREFGISNVFQRPPLPGEKVEEPKKRKKTTGIKFKI